jgi:predicted RNA-binding Zn ribbon-like protein
MAKQKVQSRFQFDLSGGALCLDFANTISRREIPDEVCDHLSSYDDLLGFATQSLYIPADFARRLGTASAADPHGAARSVERAHRLREAIYRTFRDCAEGQAPSADDLKLIQTMTVEGWKHTSLTRVGRGYRWLLKHDEATGFDGIVWPIAHSAADLLTSDRLYKVRICEARTCAWLFLDESRNHSRRWCDMKVCGNREKARRHYQRERK